MPSVFPGMDPFIEGYKWDDFHINLITAIQSALVPALRPDYAIRAKKRIYIEHPYDAPRLIRPDLTIVRDPLGLLGSRPPARSSSAMLEPVERTLPGPVDIEEKYLLIRHLESSEVIAVIELLSPSISARTRRVVRSIWRNARRFCGAKRMWSRSIRCAAACVCRRSNRYQRETSSRSYAAQNAGEKWMSMPGR